MKSFTWQKLIHDLPEASRCFLTDEMLLFDLETTGLSASRNRIYMAGLGWMDEDQIIVCQYLAENATDEALLIEEVSKIAAEDRFQKLVSFNGTTFDLPFFSKRLALYHEAGKDNPLDRLIHLDLYRSLHSIRHLFPLTQFRQKNYETLLGIAREDQYDGGKLISVYHRYEKTKQQTDCDLLVLHNREDLFGMFHLTSLLSFRQIKEQSYQIERIQATSANELSIRFRLPVPVPFSVRQFKPNGSLLLREANGLIVLPLYQGSMRCYFSDPQNYYYLTAEQTVVHKSVGKFVDASFRRQAEPKECYTSFPVPPEYLDGTSRQWEDSSVFLNIKASAESFLQML